jgi:hypothetical protein
MTQMYGAAVRCKRFSSGCRLWVLHQCIRPLIGAHAPGHHGYQRACVLITGQASSGPFGSPGFACAGKTGPPSRLILSQTSAGNCGATSWLAPYRCSSFVRAERPFLRPGLRLILGTARRGRQGWPSRLTRLRLGVSRPRLDGTEHGAMLKQIGAPSHLSWYIRSCAPC